MRLERLLALAVLGLLLPSLSCNPARPAEALVMIIETSPNNLDPRVGTDAQSEHIYKLLFDTLVRRDEHFELQPSLAQSWEVPDPQTYIFHLRREVRFHDGRALTSRDVKWTFDSILEGVVRTPKSGTYRLIDSVEAPDDQTVVFRLKEPFASFLWNLGDGAIGIVPYGAGADFNRHLVGSGPFRLVAMQQDRDVVVERNPDYWGQVPQVRRVRFAVVPDTTTRALELRKGSADLAINSLTADMVEALRANPDLAIQVSQGTIYQYLALNLQDPILGDVRVRQALACAVNREPMMRYLWRGLVRPAASVLPPQHWAFNPDVPTYAYNPGRARQLLDEAGYPAGPDGVRFHLTMKTSTEESSRLVAAVLQQQLREVGIELEVRSFEFATFYADVTRGAFQLYSLRWIGGNEDPDIFEYLFHSARTPPAGANRGHYSNPRVDELLDRARIEPARDRRKQLYAEVQRIVAEELPYINLWYLDNVLVHHRRVAGVAPGSSADYDFLKTARLEP